jgi:hypothetical protein
MAEWRCNCEFGLGGIPARRDTRIGETPMLRGCVPLSVAFGYHTVRRGFHGWNFMAQKNKEWQIGSGTSYFHRVHRPLQCLVFISPLLIFYQTGAAFHPWQPGMAGGERWDVVAFILMQRFFSLFGATGTYLPLLAVVGILVGWHLTRRDPWDFDWRLYAGMAVESVMWGIPFFVIGMAIQQHIPSPGAAGLSRLPWETQVVLSVGAGIYEELMFRLIAIMVLSLLFVDVLELKPAAAVPLIVATSAVLFSAYHYLGTERFEMGTFAFRAVMGVFLAGIYVYRGYGITVGAHTVYDLIVVGFSHVR